MTLYSYMLVYPEGDILETDRPLAFNQLVDINGRSLQPPLESEKMIVYRVYRVSTKENIGEVIKYYYLELVRGRELFSLAGKPFPC